MPHDHEVILVNRLQNKGTFVVALAKVYLESTFNLAQGGIAVKLSRVVQGVFQLGLFTLRDYDKNEVITTYGGSVMYRHHLPKAHKSHARAVPGSMYCYSAWEWAQCFHTSLQTAMKNKAIDAAHELTVPASRRTIIEPVDNVITAKVVKATGVGYMANSKPQATLNNMTQREISIPRRSKRGLLHSGVDIIYYVAKKKIPKGTELFCKYANDGGNLIMRSM